MLDTVMHPGVETFYTHERINRILEHPHLLGHIMGYTKLTEMHSEWIWHLWGQPEGIHPAIMAARGTYKTTSLTQVGPLWWLLFHPNDRIGLLRETFTVAAETLAVITKACKMPEIIHLFHCVQPELGPLRVLQEPFGKLLLSCKTTATKELSIQAHGIDQLPTGTHFDRAMLDDVVTRQDRLSKAKRVRTIDAIREVLANIIDPGKSVMHGGTPWDKDDAWKLWEAKPTGDEEEDEAITLQPPRKIDIYQAGIHTPAQIKRIQKTTTPSLFAANCLLKHIADEDQIFKDMQWGTWDPKVARVYCHVDAKYDGDHTMAVTFAAKRKDGKIQIYGKVYTSHIKAKVQEILNLCVRFRVRKILVETNPDKGYAGDLLNRRPTEDRPPILVGKYHEEMNKHAKIVSYALEYWDELIFDPNSDEAYLAQIQDYRQGQEPDDAPDSLASMLRRAFYPGDPKRGQRNVLNEL